MHIGIAAYYKHDIRFRRYDSLHRVVLVIENVGRRFKMKRHGFYVAFGICLFCFNAR